LGAHLNDVVLLRVESPASLSRDAAVSQGSEQAATLRLKVAGVLPDKPGNLNLRVTGLPPANAFVNRIELAAASGLTNKANLLFHGPLVEPRSTRQLPRFLEIPRRMWNRIVFHRPPPALTHAVAPTREALPFLSSLLQSNWTLADAELSLNYAPDNQGLDLRSSRVFIDRAISAAAQKLEGTNAIPVLTYLASAIVAGTNLTPYSMITAAKEPYVPADLRDDEIIVSDWLAQDLAVKPGDELEVRYFLPDSGSKLMQATNRFRVRSVYLPDDLRTDKTLMPDFPGLEKAENTRDWDPNFPFTYKIRPKDEQYWKEHRGTPKAFITMAAGQSMWANRFGDVTSIRVRNRRGMPTGERWYRFKTALTATIRPEQLGLRFDPVRDQALQAAVQGQDFGQLFMGFSIFLVVSALVLMGLLFQFSLEQRMAESGILLALGFTSRRVRNFFLFEGALLGLFGGIAGTLLGIGYARLMMWGLATVWRNAVGSESLAFHFTPVSLLIGLAAGTCVALFTVWLSVRKQARQPVPLLLSGQSSSATAKKSKRNWSKWIAIGAGLASIVITILALASGATADAESFFSAGSLLLIAGLAGTAILLRRVARPVTTEHFSLGRLSIRGIGRRRTRSLATVGLLACGSFVILAIGVFRLDAGRDSFKRSSGTGGFAIIGESTLPIIKDLNTKSGRDAFALNDQDMAGVSVVAFRVHQGDEASCLNLGRAQKPRILGVDPEQLASRNAFSFKQISGMQKGWSPWLMLRADSIITNGISQSTQDRIIPAIGDANSIQWALGKKIGDVIDYQDEAGHSFKLKLVGSVNNSILQGSLIIDESAYLKLFPGESGYRMFLIDAPSNSVHQVSATLARAMQDSGLELTSAAKRLNAFNAVQNTYLGTFQVLGGLGLILGSAGLGIVVLRNVLERRGELALLTAIGLRRKMIQKLVLREHAVLLAAGLLLGAAAAVIAVLPAILSPQTQLPYGVLAWTIGGVLINGLFWTWAATRVALRGNLLAALRNE
jgi:putative ABC transport system permease protein